MHRLNALRMRKKSRARGVSMTETALLLFGIFLAAAAGIKPVGPAIDCGVNDMVGNMLFLPPSNACAGNGGASTASPDSAGGRASSGGSRGSGSSGSSASSGSGASGASRGSGSLGGATGGWDDGPPVDTNGESFSDSMRGASPQQTDLALADLSNDVYEEKNRRGAGSFRPVSNADLKAAGIDPKTLVDTKSGFKAGVYTDGDHYVVAFAGTDDRWDAATDAVQAAGYSTAQYVEAAALAQKAKVAYGDNVVFTGHSLGGGLAATAAAVTGNSAVTFNAAGVSNGQLEALGIDPAAARAAAANGQIRAYHLQGEALTSTQEAISLVAPTALGKQIELTDPSPPGFWSRATGFATFHSLGNHKMGSVLNALHRNPPVGINPRNPS